MFWTISILIVLAAALVTCWPLLRSGTGWWKTLATALVALVPVAALYLYVNVGTPDAINMPSPQRVANQGGPPAHQGAGTTGEMAGDLDTLTESLRARLEENPDDLEGWLLLARSYKTVQRYPEALNALENAQRIAPDDPFVIVEMVEAQLYASGQPTFSVEMVATLESALAIDPNHQKGLFLLGVASVQSGDDRSAIGYWETLLAQLEPGSPPAQSVQEQIAAANGRLGIKSAPVIGSAPVIEPESDIEQVDGWSGIKVQVGVDSATDPSELPANAVLFVIARSPGGLPGPPLGVHRVINPTLPLEFVLNDQHAMTPGRLISAEQAVELQARLSLSGAPNAAPGDWQSTKETVPITVDSQSAEPVALSLVQFAE